MAVDETKEKIEALQKERDSLTEKLKATKQKDQGIKTLKDRISNLHGIWKELSFEEQRNILISIINKIVIKDHNIDIYYNELC